MEITLINEQNLHAFREILPQAVKLPPLLFGCVREGTAVGAAAVEDSKDGCSLAWLWVAPAYRRQGAGSALLDAACQAAGATPAKKLTLTYPADASWATVMDYMLMRRGFMVFVHTYPQYRFTKKELLATPLLARLQDKPDPRVVPLAGLKHFQLQELIVQAEQEGQYFISRASFEQMDQTRSMALVHEGRVEGLALIRPLEAEDILCLDLVHINQPYLEKMGVLPAIAMLRQAALAAFRHPAGVKELRFTCMAEVGVQLCRRLMGEKETFDILLCHGTLHTELYRPGRGQHEPI